MIINKLEKMESLVAKNYNLIWKGWDVAEIKKSDFARTSTAGIRIKDKWYIQKVFPLTRNGWTIDDKYKV